jgi:hypothetical protein
MLRSLSAVFALALIPACGGDAPPPPDESAAMQPQEPNTLTAEERAAGWRLLFDGATTAGWRGFRQPGAPDGWRVAEGALVREGGGGDLITDEQFENFDLALEWRIAEGGNSGIMFRVSEDDEATYRTGPEMQVLDDARHLDGGSRLTAAGSNYALHAAPEGVVRPAGEWNQARLVVNGAHVEHWLNGVKVVEYELWSPEWEALVRDSKFHEWPQYGRVRRGHLALQDHGDRVSYRNIKVRVLP